MALPKDDSTKIRGEGDANTQMLKTTKESQETEAQKAIRTKLGGG